MEKMPTSQFENFLGQIVKVKVDRALGTKHPKYDFVYDANYGFVPGVMAPDGEELDAYVLGISEPVGEFLGKCVAIIHRTDDDDDKLVIVSPEAENISDDEIRRATNFQEQFFQSVIIRK